ncbi:MAG TPA: IS1380 family transposase [Lautropia sp.]|nr:IS1380 family transposase [Lautropia sp.]
MEATSGEAQDGALGLVFDRRLKLEFRGTKITSDGGLLACRALDDTLGLSETAGDVLTDTRTGANGRHSLVGQFRQSVFGRLAGYEDVNDADRLAHDPAMRWVVGGAAVTGQAASTSQMGRFETEVMTQGANLAALTDLSGRWIDVVHARRPVKGIVLDMDSSVSPTHGEQEGTAYNGHFGCTCYHPLFVFNQFGDLERCALRPGNVHSAEGWRDVLEPVVARYRTTLKRRYFRADAAFASPEVYAFLEAEGYGYAIRLPTNAVLQRRIAHLLTRPVGRPPNEVRRFYASFRYQAQTWSHSRRVVAKVEWHPGELYPRVGFLVTNLCRPPERVVAFYNQRGTAEQWIKAGKNAVRWTRLSCRSMTANAVRLQLHALAYNLANFFRTLVLPDEIERWSLTTLREKVVKIGAKVIAHARYTTFQIAEVAVPRDLFRRILEMIEELRPRQVARC